MRTLSVRASVPLTVSALSMIATTSSWMGSANPGPFRPVACSRVTGVARAREHALHMTEVMASRGSVATPAHGPVSPTGLRISDTPIRR